MRNDDSGPGRFAEVAGVVESTRMVDLRRDVRGQIFTTFAATGYPKFALVARAAPGAVDASAFARAIASACAVVTLVGLAGTAIPALAITRVNPLTALRAE